MSLERGHIRAIARVVLDAGGDADDVMDLVDVHERAERDWAPRVDVMRRLNASRVCRCLDGGDEPTEDGRCSRCCARLRSAS